MADEVLVFFHTIKNDGLATCLAFLNVGDFSNRPEAPVAHGPGKTSSSYFGGVIAMTTQIAIDKVSRQKKGGKQ